MRQRLKEFSESLTVCLETWHPGHDWEEMTECLPICDHAQLVGFAYYKPFQHVQELGIVIHKDHQNKGLGKWAIKTLTERAKMDGVETLIAKVFKKNERMVHLMKKLGWRIIIDNADHYRFEKHL